MDKIEHILEVLERWAEVFTEAYRDKLSAIRASGELADSLEWNVRLGDGEYTVTLDLATYWKYIEDGRMPGSWPPVDAILGWIRIKPILPQPIELPSGRVVLPSDEQLAFLIGRKIAQDGIAPNPLLLETFIEQRTQLIEELKVAFHQDITDELHVIFAM